MTLIEILVVCLIIALLVAIALPMFLSQKSDAQDVEAKTATRTARVAIETWFTERETYEATEAELVALEPALSNARNLSVSGTEDTFRLSVDSTSGAQGGGTFTILRAADGRITRTCTNPGRGGCRSAPDADGNLW
jgi:type II secretory pathway pseudopilin PulG